ncbi:unnamed protein product [Closterium sp. NIES-53]
MAAQELRWLTFLLTDLGEWPSSAPTLFADNKAMILLCQEPRLESRVKHIDVRYFLLRELQRRGQARLDFVASEANTVDIFTKALPPGDHHRMCGDFVIHLELAVFLFLTANGFATPRESREGDRGRGTGRGGTVRGGQGEGDRERGDRERGDRERGNRERGDRERGTGRGGIERGGTDRERGDKERGDKEGGQGEGG